MPQNLLDQLIAILEEGDGKGEDELLFLNTAQGRSIIGLISILESKFEDLEQGKRKKVASKGQQLLILKHLGLLDIIDKLGLEVNARAYLLSVLLNASAENIEKDLQNIDNGGKSGLAIERNYTFLIDLFNKINMKSKAEEMELVLDQIMKKKEKVGKKEVAS